MTFAAYPKARLEAFKSENIKNSFAGTSDRGTDTRRAAPVPQESGSRSQGVCSFRPVPGADACRSRRTGQCTGSSEGHCSTRIRPVLAQKGRLGTGVGIPVVGAPAGVERMGKALFGRLPSVQSLSTTKDINPFFSAHY